MKIDLSKKENLLKYYKMQKKKDYYKILGVSKDATKEEIKSSYKTLAKRYHPDLNKSKDIVELFKEINEAYSVLSDNQLRKVYDSESYVKTKAESVKKDYKSPVVDLPYKCKRCGKWVTIDTRHPWQHDCRAEEQSSSTEKQYTPHKTTEDIRVQTRPKSNKNIIKKIVISSLIIIAILITLYIFNNNPKLNVTLEEIKNTFSNKTNTITFQNRADSTLISIPAKLTCADHIKALMPEYVIISNYKSVQIPNYWKDGVNLFFNENEDLFNHIYQKDCLRNGQNEGENVNYYYLSNRCKSFTYSKKIIDKDGTVLGTRYFEIIPILKESPINPAIELSNPLNRGAYSIDPSSSFSKISWRRFSDKAKQVFKSDVINIIIKNPLTGRMINNTYSNENAEISFGVPFTEPDNWDTEYYQSGLDNGGNMIISPDITRNKIYEIVSYDVKTCKWIDE